MDPKPPTLFPSWIFNAGIKSAWKHICTQVLHPFQVPSKLSHFGTLLRQTKAEQDLLQGALESHITLTWAQLVAIQDEIHFPVPRPGGGSGRHGRVVKRDLAEGLVNHYFNDMNSTELARSEMVRALIGRGWKHVERKSCHTKDILAAWRGVEREDAHEFMQLAAVALDEEHVYNTYKQRQQARTPGTPSAAMHTTPKSLSGLIPRTTGCTISRHPQLKRYQCQYMMLEGRRVSVYRLSRRRFPV